MTRPTTIKADADAPAPVRTFVIIATAYVTPPPRSDDPPYFEIIAAPDHAKYAVRTVIRTRDATLYARALAAEGTEERFLLSWRTVRSPSRSINELLEMLAPPPESKA